MFQLFHSYIILKIRQAYKENILDFSICIISCNKIFHVYI